MSKRKKEHYIEGWCRRRLEEFVAYGGDFDEIGRMLGYDRRVADTGSGTNVTVATYYGAALMFVESGLQIYVFDRDFEREIASTDVDERTYDIAYERLPHDCLFIELHEDDVLGVFAWRNVDKGELQFIPIPKDGDVGISRERLKKMRNVAAYIGSSNADIHVSYKPSGNGRPTKRRSTATWHEVGFRMGAQLRQYERTRPRSVGGGGTVRPHVRRAHWHHYWVGPMGGERKLVLRWVPPTFVAMADGGIESATGHLVPNDGK